MFPYINYLHGMLTFHAYVRTWTNSIKHAIKLYELYVKIHTSFIDSKLVVIQGVTKVTSWPQLISNLLVAPVFL